MKFDLMLNASDKDFQEKLFSALGIKEGDEVEIMTPQFNRTDGKTITYYPRTKDEFAALQTFSEETLRKLGLGVWEKSDFQIHYLYPGEWHKYIPAGLLVTDINGEVEPFMPNITDDDIRFGCLAYGFIQTVSV